MASADELGLSISRTADLPVGAQLAGALRERIGAGALRPGERLPSVRELAIQAGVNVNTVRAVYRRLESDGLVRSEHGRGTFVTAARPDAVTRRELRRQIAALEAELARHGRRALAPADSGEPVGAGARLPTAGELTEIRDALVERLEDLDVARAEVLRRLAELEPAETDAEAGVVPSARRSTHSLRGARVRWVGA